MKVLILITALFGLSQSYGSELKRGVGPFNIYKQDSIQTERKLSQLKIHFANSDFKSMPKGYQQKIMLSINGVLQTIVLDSTYTYTWDLEPGKYVLKLWPGIGYEEIITDSLTLKDKIAYSAIVDFYEVNENVIVDKPVIYFKTEKTINFSLEVIPSGTFTFTYPRYQNKWQGNVKQDGSIEIEGSTYPYLFWESNQAYRFKPSSNGFHIKKEEVTVFLEQKLTELGFTATERTDFITYWGPKLVQSEELFIQFEFDQQCDQYATLSCNPQPESVHRVYISFCTWNEAFNAFVAPKTFEPLNRSGFSILEWGGHSFQFIIPEFVAKTF